MGGLLTAHCHNMYIPYVVRYMLIWFPHLSALPKSLPISPANPEACMAFA